MSETSFKVQDSISGRHGSQAHKYRQMIIGTDSWLDLIKYELIILLVSRLPGALGVFLRSKLYPLILGEVGKGVAFGANIALRHPHKIRIGDGTIIDDNILLDAKGETNRGITIGRDVFLGRNTILSCKDGDIELGDRANVGFNCQIFSASLVRVGQDDLISAYTYMVGGGNYDLERTDIPINQSLRADRRFGIRLADNIWIGTHCVVLDGVSIGEGTAVAPGSVVTENLPGGSIAAGMPARVIKERPRDRPPPRRLDVAQRQESPEWEASRLRATARRA
jgi:acetyltransferase-like isoleucine patch superfamily enzyme